jgi:hypothetical protein
MSQPINYFFRDGGSCRRSSSRKKGGGFAALLSCKNRRNPVVEFYLQLHVQEVDNLDPHQLIGLSQDIDKVLDAGRRQLEQVVAAHARLCRTTPQEGMDFVPQGF